MYITEHWDETLVPARCHQLLLASASATHSHRPSHPLLAVGCKTSLKLFVVSTSAHAAAALSVVEAASLSLPAWPVCLHWSGVLTDTQTRDVHVQQDAQPLAQQLFPSLSVAAAAASAAPPASPQTSGRKRNNNSSNKASPNNTATTTTAAAAHISRRVCIRCWRAGGPTVL